MDTGTKNGKRFVFQHSESLNKMDTGKNDKRFVFQKVSVPSKETLLKNGKRWLQLAGALSSNQMRVWRNIHWFEKWRAFEEIYTGFKNDERFISPTRQEFAETGHWYKQMVGILSFNRVGIWRKQTLEQMESVLSSPPQKKKKNNEKWRK